MRDLVSFFVILTPFLDGISFFRFVLGQRAGSQHYSLYPSFFSILHVSLSFSDTTM